MKRRCGRILRRSIASIHIFLLVLLLPNSGLAAPNPFSELPTSHWTYSAIDRMAHLGLSGRAYNGVARLGWRLTRVEMAFEVAGILDRLALRLAPGTDLGGARSGHLDVARLVAAYNAEVDAEQQLSSADSQLLQDLVREFRSDLEALGYRFEASSSAAGGIDAVARALGRFQISGQGLLQYQEVSPTPTGPPNQLVPPALSQQYRLHVDYIDDDVMVGATMQSEFGTSLWGDAVPVPFSVNAVNIGLRDGLVARVGDLSGTSWSDLTVDLPAHLHGVQAGVQVGRFGSTLLLARDPARADYLAALDGTIYLNRLTIGASFIRAAADGHIDEPEGTLASVQGSYVLRPGLVVTGGLASSVWGTRDAAAMQIGGSLQLTEMMALSAIYRTEGAGFQRAFAVGEGTEGERRELDVAFDLGDARFTAGIGRALRQTQTPGLETTASVGISYPVTDLTVVRASRETRVLDPNVPEDRPTERSYTTALGVDFFLPSVNVNLRLGYEYEQRWDGIGGVSPATRAEAALEYALPNLTESTGLSFSLRYQVVDSTGDPGTDESNVGTTAQLAIRF